jgi:hypothetical protein
MRELSCFLIKAPFVTGGIYSPTRLQIFCRKAGFYGKLHIRGLGRDNRTSYILVILLTARSSEDQRLDGLHEGADDYSELIRLLKQYAFIDN